MAFSPSVHRIQVRRTARLAILGTPSAASAWWVVLHGYGQLAGNFVEPFETIATTDRCVIAPEGLSRFYLDGMDNHERVGASWMTRDDRTHEIDDYVRYLDDVIEYVAGDANTPSICVLGFSQGAATASRWVLLGETTVDRMVLWGGAPAHDLDLSKHAGELGRLDLTLVSGTEDPYISDEQRSQVRDRLETLEIEATYRTFEGGHRIDTSTLEHLVADRPSPHR